MPLPEQAPASDLLLPSPARGEQWDPWLIHTHYFGFCVPERALAGFAYIRYQPAFPLCGGGVMVYEGLDNVVMPSVAHMDYELTQPWPTIDGDIVTTANGLSYDFAAPGEHIRIAYASADGSAAIDLDARAITPLCARGHLLPDEVAEYGHEPGGSEQFMHMTGTVRLGDEEHAVDCNYARDRSWGQVRREARDANVHPPLCWTPMYFGKHLAFNQIGFEDRWRSAFNIPDGAPAHGWGWLCREDELLDITKVRRKVTRVHPVFGSPLDQEIEVTDERGDSYLVRGTAVAFSPIPGWHNLASTETLTRWEDETGAVAHGPAQNFWGPRAARMLRDA